MESVGSDSKPSPGYSVFLLPFEHFDVKHVQAEFRECWHYSIYIAAIYLVTAYSLEKIIKKKYESKPLLTIWNASLAVFSAYGCYHVSKPLILDLYYVGLDRTVCWEEYYFHEGDEGEENLMRKKLAYWLYLFCLSKFPELFDTAFIVAKKAPLQLLQTYHHATVLVFSWHILAYGPAASYWYSAMNFFVHAVMYSYYAARAMNIRVPSTLAKIITSMQSLQMLVGFSVNFYSLYKKYTGQYCGNTLTHNFVAIGLYGSYLILFLRFAYYRYGPRTDKPKKS